MGHVKIKRGHLRMVVSLPDSYILFDQQMINKTEIQIKFICQKNRDPASTTHCEELFKHLLFQKDDLFRTTSKLEKLTTSGTRRKRGLLGKLLTGIFGVNEEVYADLETLQQNQQILSKATNQQMLLLTTNINQSNRAAEEKLKQFDERVAKVISSVNEMKSWNTAVDHNRLSIEILACYISAEGYFQELAAKYNSWLKAAHGHGNLLEFISPQDVTSTFQKVEEAIGRDFQVLRTMQDKIQLSTSGNSLQLSGHFGIIERENYDFFHVTPIPHVNTNNSFQTARLESSTWAVNYDQQSYFTLSEEELKNCLSIQSGRCGRNSPCEQLCYEIHYGMYECGCTEGYELDKNGYSCQEMNTTFSLGGEHGSRGEEDVLYQKGVSFSAKLEGPTKKNPSGGGSDDDDDGDDDDDEVESQPGIEDNKEIEESAEGSDGMLLRHQIENIRNYSNRTAMSTSASSTTEQAAIYSSGNDDNFYAKQDMSIYDDVNNNRLNIRPYHSDTYQNEIIGETSVTSMTATKASTSIPTTLGTISNISATTKFTESTVTTSREPCLLDCGPEGSCEYEDESAIVSSSGVTTSTTAASSRNRMRCQCPFGKAGKGCTEDSKINIPRFTKKSWLAFPALKGAYKHVQLRIEFRPESFDGIILLTGERDDLTGDFMALLIHQGFIEFWFDCGSGTGSVRSKETVVINQWNSVTIYRHRWDAWLVLNYEERIQGRSKGLFSRITFREPVFLGGTGNITGLAKRLPVYDGMVGCIRRFIANEHEYKFEEHPLGDVTKGFDIQDCTTDKCVKYPCQHGGKCLPSDQGAVCLCPLGYEGDLCEMRLDLQVPSFNGSSYLRYAPLGDSALIWLEIEIVIKAHRGEGLLLYSGHEDSGDFIALSLKDAFVEFSFDLGSGLAFVKSKYPLSLGQWHSIKISRTARLAVLKVDQSEEVMTVSPNGFWHLSLPHSLFLGGIHNAKKPPVGLKDQASFVGCIQKVDINGRTLAIISEALGGTNIGNCPHACVARPCGPLSECVPLMDNYECRCTPFNSLCNKAEEVSLKQVRNRNNNTSSTNWKNDSKSSVSHRSHHQKTKKPSKSSSYHQHYWKSASSKHYKHSVVKHEEPSKQQKGNQDDPSDYKKPSHKKNFPQKEILGPQSVASSPGDEYLTDYAITNSESSGNPMIPITKFHKRLGLRKSSKGKESSDHHHIIVDKHIESYRGQSTKHDRNNRGHGEHIKARTSTTTSTTTRATSMSQSDDSASDESEDDSDYDEDLIDYVVEDNANDDNYDTGPIGLVRDDDADEELTKSAKEIPHYEKHQHKTDRTDIDSEANYLFDDEEDYRAKDFIQDMKRIMKNSDRGRSKNKMQGTPNYKRSSAGACFTGTDSFFHYNDAETMSHVISYRIDLNLRFKTHSRNGVILWSGRQSALDNDDFLSLGIEDGYLHLRYNLGSGEANIQFNGTKVSDGLWHRVRATRKLQEGSLEVDGRKSVVQRSPGKLAQLNTDTGLYVGGMPNVMHFTRQRYYSGIVGCISEIVLAGEVKLTLDPATLGTAHNVEVGIL